MSLHPTQTDDEVDYICKAIRELALNFETWKEDYTYDPHTNEFNHKGQTGGMVEVQKLFSLE